MTAARAALGRLIDRVQPSEPAVVLGTSVVVGTLTGLAAVAFIWLIRLVHRVLYVGGESLLPMIGRGLVVVVPVVGALLAGAVIAAYAREAKGHGVPEVMAAIALRGGRIRPRVAVAKIGASALCIGSGGSAGREGPIVQVGAALGSTVGQLLDLSEPRVRNLVACGAASGVAAAFNAPIAGVLFAMEIILAEFRMADLGNVIVSAVAASLVARVFMGDNPAFSIPAYAMQSPAEIVLYVLLGALSALAAVAFIKILYALEDRFDRWRFPLFAKPAVGGLALGVLGLVYPLVLAAGPLTPAEAGLGQPISEHLPQVYGSGFETIEQALRGELVFLLLAALVLLKPLATGFTLGSGNSGGVFAPALFTGSALGGAFGLVMQRFLPGAVAPSGAYAAVGMAAVFAGAARAPLTAFMIVFEMTEDYRLMLPLMAGVISSYLVAERLHSESIYTLKLVRRGVRLVGGRDLDVMQSVRVDEVMTASPTVIPSHLPLPMLGIEFLRTGRHGFPVVDDEGMLVGVVSLADYRRAGGDEAAVDALVVGDIMTRDVVVAYPDETIGMVLRKMAPRDLSRLPVVDRSDACRVIGVVRRNDVVRAYDIGVIRREEARRRAATEPSVGDRGGVRFVDAPVAAGSAADGIPVAEIELPRDLVLVSIRRGRELVIPHGDTILRAGDVVTALCADEAVAAFRAAIGPVRASAADLPGARAAGDRPAD